MRRAHFPFVVISGLPGSGKTTVARALAQSMSLPLFDKDEILERLFDSKGTGDAIWRRRLSRESDAILQAAVSSSAGAIVSSFWHAAGMPSDSGTPTGWLTGLSGTIVNVHCKCPPEVAAERFIRRTRHAGHLDEARTAADVRASIHALVPCGPLAIGEQVVVDTTKPLVAVSLMQDVQAALRCAELATRSRRRDDPVGLSAGPRPAAARPAADRQGRACGRGSGRRDRI